MSTKNPIKYVRNPNSPEAIEARLNNLPDPTPPTRIQLITDKSAGQIIIDLTESEVDQRIGYIITGGSNMSRKLIKSIIGKDPKTGRMTMTNYYVDTKHKQWIIIKDFMSRESPPQDDFYHSDTFPRSTYGGGFVAASCGVGAPGENWRNQGKSVDKLRARMLKVHKLTTIAPNTKQDIDIPEDDQYHNDFDGIS